MDRLTPLAPSARALLVLLLTLSAYCSLVGSETVVVPVPTPGSNGYRHNDYRCASVPTPLEDSYIVQYDPLVDPRLAHHMLVYGCQHRPHVGSWDCKTGQSGICNGRDSPKIVFAWALNASGIHMPPDVGLKVGPSAAINYLVIQVHYGHAEEIPDITAVSKEALIVHTTKLRQKFIAGIYMLGTGRGLKAGLSKVYSDAACEFPGPKTIVPFAFRTHAHSLGRQIVGYVIKSGEWEVIGTRSPQDPQAFYPVGKEIQVNPHDWLAVRCVFNTESRHHTVYMGPDSEDEMCNFYMMYYTVNNDRHLTANSCWNRPPSSLHYPRTLPPLPHIPTHHHGEEEEEEGPHVHSHVGNGNNPLPTIPTHHEEGEEPNIHRHGGNNLHTPTHATPPPDTPPPDTPPPAVSTASPTEPPPTNMPTNMLVPAEDWALNGVPIPLGMLGQVSAAAVDSAGNVYILHRGPVVWDYGHIEDGPIEASTLLRFSASTGKPDHAWGGSLFYMPHGLTIDHEGNFWITDIAMHQVFKFSSPDDTEPSLVLGTAFKPGTGYTSFCQPSSVAVEKSGVFYVADGYCNHRIMKFNSEGQLAEVWDAPIDGINMFIPHKAILNAAEDILYVADRENMRVLSFSTTEGGRGQVLSDARQLGGKPYSISFNSSETDWPMYGVQGGFSNERLVGFALDSSGTRIGTWGPNEGFTRPHDLTVDTVHGAVYVTEIGPNKIWKFVQFPSAPRDFSLDLEEALDSSSRHWSQQPSDSPSQANSSNQNSTLDSQESEESNSVHINAHHGSKKSTAGVNVGVVVAVLAVVALVILVTVGVLKEHRFIKYRGWRLLQAGERDSTVGVKPNGSTTHREAEKKKKKKKKRKLSPQKKLQSLLGPSNLGFSRLKTYDSNSEDEEFPVFNRV